MSTRWTVHVTQNVVDVLETMRASGETDLREQLVRFIGALGIEAGGAVDADKPLPGLPMGDGRCNVDVPRLPVLVAYTVHPEAREIRFTDLLWLA